MSRTGNNGFDYALPASSTRNYTADGLDKYTAVDSVSPTYDTRGNLTNDGTKTYGYDYDNRLTSATGGVTLSYDPQGRLDQVVGASTTRFRYDGANTLLEYNGSNVIQRRYVYGPGDDEPLVWYEGSGTSDRRYLLTDERGSVIARTDSAGNVAQVNKYDAYGVPDAANQGRFQYTGQRWISELGLYDYKARAYHPTLGRFMQTDPIGMDGGMNLYAYVGNDPVSRSDPFGLECRFVTHIETPVVYQDGLPYPGTGILKFDSAECDVGTPSGGGDGDGGVGGGGGPVPQENLNDAQQCRDRVFHAEFRVGAYGTFRVRIPGLGEVDVDIDLGSWHHDFLTGENRVTTGFDFAIAPLGVGGGARFWSRDIPIEGNAPAALWQTPSEGFEPYLKLPFETGTTHSLRGLGGALGLGIGGSASYDLFKHALAPAC